jgi:dGTP triphosphohydrolase
MSSSIVLDVIPQSNITIEQYSEKCIAVFGDTQNFKDVLMQLGGKFNPMLKGLNDTKRPGWVFVKNNDIRAKLLQSLQNGGSSQANNSSSTTTLKKTSTVSPSIVASTNDELMKIVQQLSKRLDSVETELFAVRKILHAIDTPSLTKRVLSTNQDQTMQEDDEDVIEDYDDDEDQQTSVKKSKSSEHFASPSQHFVSLLVGKHKQK